MTSWWQSNTERKHNLIVVNPSTPAQYFHCLRRQIHRPFTKPLVVMTAKSLLHHRPCSSSLADMGTGTFFQRVIIEGCRGDNMAITRPKDSNSVAADAYRESAVETWSPSSPAPRSTVPEADDVGRHVMAGKKPLLDPPRIQRVIFCSGKVYYQLYHQRAALSIDNITFVRVEQIAPFPYPLIDIAIRRFPNAEIVWVQEEPKNMGAWTYVKPRFDTCVREYNIADRTPIRLADFCP
jgi:2-oxoglutarate dehydrogenase E1 component